jgi:hypothetical protein
MELRTVSNAGKGRRRFNSLIPAIDQTTTGESLRNGHPLLLTTGQTTEGRVADPGVPTVVQADHSHQGIRDVVYVALPGRTNDASMGGTSLCSKSERFFHRKRGEMDIVFRDEL